MVVLQKAHNACCQFLNSKVFGAITRIFSIAVLNIWYVDPNIPQCFSYKISMCGLGWLATHLSKLSVVWTQTLFVWHRKKHVCLLKVRDLISSFFVGKRWRYVNVVLLILQASVAKLGIHLVCFLPLTNMVPPGIAFFWVIAFRFYAFNTLICKRVGYWKLNASIQLRKCWNNNHIWQWMLAHAVFEPRISCFWNDCLWNLKVHVWLLVECKIYPHFEVFTFFVACRRWGAILMSHWRSPKHPDVTRRA